MMLSISGLPGWPPIWKRPAWKSQQVGELLLRVARLFAQVLKSFRQIHKDHLRTKAYHKAGLHATHSGRRLGNGPLHSATPGCLCPSGAFSFRSAGEAAAGQVPYPKSYTFWTPPCSGKGIAFKTQVVMIKSPDQPSGKVYLTGKRSPRPSRGRPGALLSYEEAERYPLREYPRSG